jgi:predicted tellurium resistance membrane protein TerC
MLLDIIFSLDSVITAVGMARQIWVMIAAVIVAVGVMVIFANPVGRFVERHPTITILALSFLILIGMLLVADGLGQHLDKGYIYFAMACSLVVEMLNMRVRKQAA